jgi:hypothetical protein
VEVTLTPKGLGLHHDTKCLSETLLESSGLTPPDLIRLNTEISALRDALVRNGAVSD